MSTPIPAFHEINGVGRADIEVADIVRQYGKVYADTHRLTPPQAQALRDIARCRTAILGGHLEICDLCGHTRNAYNSCRNRHCPKCQGLRRAKWISKRMDQILPTHYFHTVVTAPHELNPLFLCNQTLLYNLFFEATSQAFQELARDPKRLGAQIGFSSMLHTWSQELDYHVHIHLVSTGGGIDSSLTRWIPSRRNFLVPDKALAKLVRGKFRHGLQKLYDNARLSFSPSIQYLKDPQAFSRLLRTIRRKKWVVYSKTPFGGPEQVFLYLGQYTHRVAISNHRLVSLVNNQVTFTARDNRNPGAKRLVTLPAVEFLKRFLLHIVPHRFVRIRYYGLMAARNGSTKLKLARRLLESIPSQKSTAPRPNDAKPSTWQEWMMRLTGIDVTLCPHCKKGKLLRLPLSSGFHQPIECIVINNTS